MNEATITTVPIDGGCVVVDVRGDVTFGNAASLSRELHAALDAGATRLVVDLTDLGFMDSSGLATLLSASRTAHNNDASVVLVHAPEGPPTVLRFKGIDQLLRMHTSREAALAS